MKRKPMKVGLDYVRGKDWKPRLFTRAGAVRYMEQRDSPLKRVTGYAVVVSDCGDYWRGNACAQEMERA